MKKVDSYDYEKIDISYSDLSALKTMTRQQRYLAENRKI